MKALRLFVAMLLVSSGLAAGVFGISSMTSVPGTALRPITPLCGPSFLWVCSGPGGPDILFPGTVCDKLRFEKQTGYTCVPYTF